MLGLATVSRSGHDSLFEKLLRMEPIEQKPIEGIGR